MGDVDGRGKTSGRLLSGRYRLGDVLGRGGMGTVWRAEDEVLGRTVAVKELRFPSSVDEDEKRRLITRTLREAKAIARIRSSSAVTVYDVVDEDDRPWIVMELVEGRSLADVLREDGPLEPKRAAEVGLAILDVLRAAHREGILHRDVKPSNVLIADEDGRVVLTDFGIAQIEGDPSLTSTGMLVGAPSYIAPERARGRRPGPPSDLWSLGGLLYAAVEGHPPYDKGSAIATLTAVMTEPLEPPTRAGSLEEVIHGLLEKDPDKRLDEPGARALLERAARDTDTVAETSSKTAEGTRTTVLPLVGGLASAAKAANGARKSKGPKKGAEEPKESTEPKGAKEPTGQRAAREAGASGTSDGRAGTGSSTASPASGVSAGSPTATGPAAERLREALRAVRNAAAATTATASAAAKRTAERTSSDGRAPVGGDKDAGGAGTTTVLSERLAGLARRTRQPTGIAVVAVVVLALLGTVLAVAFGGGEEGSSGARQEQSVTGGVGDGRDDDGRSDRNAKEGDAADEPAPEPSGRGDGDGDDEKGDKGDRGAGTGEDGDGDGDGDKDGPEGDKGGQGGGKALPDGFEEIVDDRFNFSMAMPEGYRRTAIAGRNSGGIYSPSGGGYPKVQVDFNGSPGESAVAAWKSLEPAVRGGSTGYSRLDIKPVRWRDYPTVADWTFERVEKGVRVRVLNRGFRVDSGRGYAIMITCKADAWDGEECRTVRKTAFRTFRPR